MATQVPMSVKTFLQTAAVLPVDVTILLRGPHGIGKSQVVRQLAKILSVKENIDYPVFDIRLGQMSEGDFIGLPTQSADRKTTQFLPPDWYREACDKPVVLFLDELNRATTELMQAASQVVLDRTLNRQTLHPKTVICVAINADARYHVNDMDIALLDRMWTIDLSPTVEDWVAWAEKNNIDGTIIDFIRGNEKWLDPAKNAEPSAVEPSRRSWERLSNSLKLAGVTENPSDLFYHICCGFIGTEAAIAFHSYAKSVDSRITGEEIVNGFLDSKNPANDTETKKKILRLGTEKLNIAVEKVIDFVTNAEAKWSANPSGKKAETKRAAQVANIKGFFGFLPAELKVSFWTKVTAVGTEDTALVTLLSQHLMDDVLAVFQIKAGDKNAKPVLPSFMEKKEEEAAKPVEIDVSSPKAKK
jgi:hypothetical protein